MLTQIARYRFLIIFLILFISVATIPAPFSYSHYHEPPYYLYFLIIFTNTLIFLITTKKLIVAEKIVYAALISMLALFSEHFLTLEILASMYGHDPFYGELNAPDVLEHIVFYCATQCISIGLFVLWLHYKKPVYPDRADL